MLRIVVTLLLLLGLPALSSPATGRYSGTFSATDGISERGEFSITVDQQGLVDGTVTSRVYNETFTVSGRLDSDGNFSGMSSSGGVFKGQVHGEVLRGTWSNLQAGSKFQGAFQGKRATP